MSGRLWMLVSIHQEKHRGRSPGASCRASVSGLRQVHNGSPKVRSDEPMFKPGWFAGDPDIEDQGGDSGDNKEDKCWCGPALDIDGGSLNFNPSDERIHAYPPYLNVRGPARSRILIKGSTCQCVMQLHAQGLQASRIAARIADKMYAEVYTPAEVCAVIRSCTMLGLTGQSPLANESWENESIEGWWFKEESYCEALRRQIPVDKAICGYDCDDGWWKNRQHERNRDWVRFGDRSIGSESQRRRL
ncbi:hypothetical protein A1O3_00043 [Capronia epimyces CBS 606.96]|uniref:Uncharacterized protein n=1 Tax=Capronia epimyces CBS 606.96 TaxID=1182542 RepID=W9YPA4_9EURO|nr:uncharacterized protein A1O3_00043 [Capronia epimyces CBS 606.96]EXJ91495.1 hypothetical protein A1O3_00043 [Capronia epimyces CBS 606.96]